MKDKVKIGLILTFCLLLSLVIQYFSSYVFDFLIFGITMVGVVEFTNLQLKAGYPVFDYCPEIACFLVFVVAFAGTLCGLSAMWLLIILFILLVVYYLAIYLGSFLIFKKELQNDKFREIANMSVHQFAFFKANNTLAAIVYPTIAMFFMYLINHIQSLGLVVFNEHTVGVPMGLFGLVLLFATCCLSDTFAMLFGTLIKGKKIFPKISPNKTVAGSLFGLLGGLIGAVLTYIVFMLIFPTAFSIVSFWQFTLIGVLGSVLSQAGDFFESYMKRRAKVKDAGDIFRSHGGVIDRFDSIIFAVPFIFICLVLIFG